MRLISSAVQRFAELASAALRATTVQVPALSAEIFHLVPTTLALHTFGVLDVSDRLVSTLVFTRLNVTDPALFSVVSFGQAIVAVCARECV